MPSTTPRRPEPLPRRLGSTRMPRWRTGATRSCSARTSTRRCHQTTNPRRSSWRRRRSRSNQKYRRVSARTSMPSPYVTPAGPKTGRKPTRRMSPPWNDSSMPIPDDLDAQVLYSEALMDVMPWSYWTRDGRPHEGTRKIIASLERVIAKNENHPGALHLWIHLWEATDTPERAEAEADRLVPLMPGAGHIVHMPAHIYQRVGRHADVIRVNQLAAKADEDYIAQCKRRAFTHWGTTRTTCTSSGWARRPADRRSSPSSRRTSSPIRCPRGSGHRSDPPGVPGGAVLGEGSLRGMGRDPRRRRPTARDAVHARCLALRARDGVQPRAIVWTRPRASWRRCVRSWTIRR